MGAKWVPKGNNNGDKMVPKSKKARPKAPFAEQERITLEKGCETMTMYANIMATCSQIRYNNSLQINEQTGNEQAHEKPGTMMTKRCQNETRQHNWFKLSEKR